MMHGLIPYIILRFLTVLSALQFAVVINTVAREDLSEKFMLHTDRTAYLTGETIFYKIYNTNYPQISEHSNIAYVNIHDKNGTLLIQQKVKLENGEGNGTVPIPLTLHEDYYIITCFTKWNVQFEKNPTEALKLAVYNPYETPPEEFDQVRDEVLPSSKILPQNIKIELQDLPFRTRQKSVLLIELPDGIKATLSISIHSTDDLNLHESPSMNAESTQTLSPVYYEKISGPVKKEQHLQIDGNVIDPETQTPLISDVLSLYKVGGSKFYRILDPDGKVSSNVDDFSGEAQFQIFNMNPYQTEMPQFVLNRAGEKLLGLDPEPTSPPRNEAINRYIKNARLSRKIHELFEVKTIDSLEGTVQAKFPFRADKVYLMDKYKGMKNFEEFIREIVTYAEVTVSDDKPTIRLKNRQTKRFFMEKPWYLVDGRLTRDEEAVLNIPFKNLIRAELFYTDKTILNQLEPMMIRSGMIAVYTDNFSLSDQIESAINYFSFKGFTEAAAFKSIHTAEKEEARENPVFNNLIYWNPSIKAEGETRIEFVTSDLTGEYIVEIKGTDENGQILSGSKKFSVTY